MSFEVDKAGDLYTPEIWRMICCRYHVAGRYAAGKLVLEVGCGTGLGLGYLSRRAAMVVGGDVSEENLSLARAHYGDRVRLVELDARKLPFEDGSFDLVLCMEVLQYLPNLDDFLDESRRVLAPGGMLVFCLPNPDIPGFCPSEESVCHHRVPALAAACAVHGLEAKIYGAFPMAGRLWWAGLRNAFLARTGRRLNRLPGGSRLRGWLSAAFLGRTIVGKVELDDADVDDQECPLKPLPADRPDRRHQTLYVIAATGRE